MRGALFVIPALLGLAGVVMFGVGVGLKRRGTMLLGLVGITAGAGGVVALHEVL